MKTTMSVMLGIIIVIFGALVISDIPSTPASVSLPDIRVRVFNGAPAELPLDHTGRLHVFCNTKRGHLIYIYERAIYVIERGCTK